jgi:hypothetical protein
MKRRSFIVTAAIALTGVHARASESAPVLVELFTSQGCNSCPRADAALARLAARDDVLPLAYHVTYWDRLGWRDTLGDASFDARQRWYGGILGTGSYTPQAVVAGEIDLVGSDPRLAQAIDLAGTNRMPARIEVARDTSAKLPGLALDGEVRLTAVAFERLRRVRIERGENAGAEIDYVNAVRALADLGAWDGTARRIKLGSVAAGDRGLALIAQDASSGRIVALGSSPA